jgi:hypothetical protein
MTIRTLHLAAFSAEPLYGPEEARTIADLAETLIAERQASFTFGTRRNRGGPCLLYTAQAG